MKPIALAAAALLLALCAAPGTGQAVPDAIPDLPGESPADRARDRMLERHRGTLARFFATGGFDFAPVSGDGSAYQAGMALGLSQRNGDAVLATVSVRQVPPIPTDDVPPIGGHETVAFFGVGYEMRATRFLGTSPLAERGSLTLGVGVLHGEVSAIALELTPAYDLLSGSDWSVPVGLELSYALFADDDTTLARPFVGIGLAFRHHFGRRERLE